MFLNSSKWTSLLLENYLIFKINILHFYYMKLRNLALTLEKAKEWYNSGSADLKEVALQAYTKDELEIPEWQNIKTFEDALRALGLDDIFGYRASTPIKIAKHLEAIWKLDIIRKALNGDWEPSLVQGSVYYPYVRFYPVGQKAREAASSNNWKLGESFIADGKKYTLVGGSYYCGCLHGGLAIFGHEYGGVRLSLGLFGCKSREIAEHMSRYFSKEIFEATYTHHAGIYEWI